MTTWLVDTHAVLWFLSDDPQLSPAAKETMESGENTLLVSAASIWEIAIKSSLGKLQTPTSLPATLHAEGFDEHPVIAEHAWTVRSLPIGSHKDPFDRLLVAQALVDGLAIISNDAQLDQYGVTRHW